MVCLLRAYSTLADRFLKKTPCFGYISPSQKTIFPYSCFRTKKVELLLTAVRVQSYTTKEAGEGSSRKRKVDRKPRMKDDKEAFFVVRKGDLVGVYKSLSDCQAQVGTSICDPPVSVYKGYSMPKDTEKYLLSRGLKNALYSIRASDLTQDLFGTLVHCPPQLSSSRGDTSSEPVTKKRPQEALWSDYGEVAGSSLTTNDALQKHFKLDSNGGDQNQSVCQSCTLEFDGASKGNPGQAGAGAVLRSDDGSLICRLREGLGVATNNFAEYRAFILGLRYALGKGFTSVRVRGDSKLVCMQIQGQWKVKNQSISGLFEEAKKLKDRFLSFQIIHVLRGKLKYINMPSFIFQKDLNSEADAQANLAVELAEGQIQEEIDK